jgi:alpha/beta superfamily hydrolase
MPTPDDRTAVVEAVRFPAGPYLLEGELVYDEGTLLPAGGVVLAGSHPMLGGTMHNNVMRGLGDGLAEHGWVSLRFNYRGVGRSEGPAVDVARHMAEFWETSHVANEKDHEKDLQGAVDFLQGVLGPQPPLLLVGYSFGCTLLPYAHGLTPPAALVLIAPPLNKHQHLGFDSGHGPVLVIASEDDFALDSDRLRHWFDQLAGPKQLVTARLDNHFFRGHEPWLVTTVLAFVKEHRL